MPGNLSLPALAILLALAAGCEPTLVDALSPTMKDIDPIVTDTSLSPQEKRQRLTDLGLPPLVINALLRNERTANQFGGDLRSAYEKVTGGRLDELTPDEVQIYGDEAESVASGQDFTLSDKQAQAIVDLFQQQGLKTPQDLADFLGDPVNAAGVSTDVPKDTVLALFVDFDPSELVDLLP